MLKNFFITSSEDRHRLYVTGLVLLISLSFIIPYCVFLIKPSIFYWRAWEYFSEVVYPNAYRSRVWKGFEKGDKTRAFFLRFQDGRFTYVSTDSDGFRTGPFHTDNYAIFVYGDSHCWGSRLSDDETFSWKLALKLNEPVYNGGRQTILGKILEKKELKGAKLIINVVDVMHVKIKSLFPENFTIEKYRPLKEYDQVQLSVKRFYPPSILIRVANGIVNDFNNQGHANSYMCDSEYRVPFNDGDNLQRKIDDPGYENNFNNQVRMVSNFSRQLSQLGYKYVLVLVPRRDLLYADKVDEYSKEYFPRLIRKLEEEGVYAVDLQEAFLANKEKGLFFHTDTHWNERGTEIAAEIVARYLCKKGLLNNVLLTKNHIQ